MKNQASSPQAPNPRFPETLAEASEPLAAAEQIIERDDYNRRRGKAPLDSMLGDDTAWGNGHIAAVHDKVISDMEHEF